MCIYLDLWHECVDHNLKPTRMCEQCWSLDQTKLMTIFQWEMHSEATKTKKVTNFNFYNKMMKRTLGVEEHILEFELCKAVFTGVYLKEESQYSYLVPWKRKGNFSTATWCHGNGSNAFPWCILCMLTKLLGHTPVFRIWTLNTSGFGSRKVILLFVLVMGSLATY